MADRNPLDAPACRLCRERGKPWRGSDPVCGFDASGAFNPDNWMCATLSALRAAVEVRQPDRFHFRDDNCAASIGVACVPGLDESPEADGRGWLVLTWYKDRGKTGRAYLVGDDLDALPLTLPLAEVCLRALAEAPPSAERDGLRLTRTERGFAVAGFLDRYDSKCSIQKSSLAFEDAIWLGIDDPEPKVLRPDRPDGTGWERIDLDELVRQQTGGDLLITTRMHLTRSHVAMLLPLLQRFVDTGELGTPEETCDA